MRGPENNQSKYKLHAHSPQNGPPLDLRYNIMTYKLHLKIASLKYQASKSWGILALFLLEEATVSLLVIREINK